jgi:hypothetical protein
MLRFLGSLVLILSIVVPLSAKDNERKKLEKELLARTPEVEFAASPNIVKAAVIDVFTKHDWQLDSDSQFQLVFSKQATSVPFGTMLGLQLGGSDPALPYINARLSILPRTAEDKPVTTVRFSLQYSMAIKNGRTAYSREGVDKNYKGYMYSYLESAKARIENPEKEADAD